jgi:hypothetical protein
MDTPITPVFDDLLESIIPSFVFKTFDSFLPPNIGFLKEGLSLKLTDFLSPTI